MGILLTLIAYAVCVVFLGRIVLHVQSWRMAREEPSFGAASKELSPGTIVAMVMDIFLFRRLYKTNKLLWLASWTFHMSFFLVVLRHLRYFMYPVPVFIVSFQKAGVYAGYVLLLSLFLIFIIRMTANHDRYLSVYNYFVLAIMFLAGLTGLLMKIFYRAMLVDVKAFTLGIVTFSPGELPGSTLFIVHFVLALILIPSLPFHLIAAPVTTMEARRREEGIHMVLHEK